MCSVVSDFLPPWTRACQAPLSMGFSRQEYWSGLPFPPPGNLLDKGPNTHFLCLVHWQVEFLPWSHLGSPNQLCCAVLCLVAQSCPTLCDLMDCSPPGSSVHGDSPGKNTGVGCHAFFQGNFPIQGLNPGLPRCRQILYCLSHQGSPRILEWVAYPFSRGSS